MHFKLYGKAKKLCQRRVLGYLSFVGGIYKSVKPPSLFFKSKAVFSSLTWLTSIVGLLQVNRHNLRHEQNQLTCL